MTKSLHPHDSKSPLTLPLRKPFTTAYGPKKKITKETLGEPRTKQQFKNECDINVIMARYKRSGVFDFVNRLQPQYADVSGHEYQAAMDLVANARSAFEDLPAAIRARFDNDPAQLLDFVHDDENYEEAVQLGLVQPRPSAAQPSATPVAPPPSKSAPAASGEAAASAPGGGVPPPASSKTP